jgi:hypothetical protein
MPNRYTRLRNAHLKQHGTKRWQTWGQKTLDSTWSFQSLFTQIQSSNNRTVQLKSNNPIKTKWWLKTDGDNLGNYCVIWLCFEPPCRKLAKNDGCTDFVSHHATILLASQPFKSHKIELTGQCVELFHENNILVSRDEGWEKSPRSRKSVGLNRRWGTRLICLEMTRILRKWQYLGWLRDWVVPWLRCFVDLLIDVF